MAHREDKTKRLKKGFLAAFAQCGIISRAASISGITRKMHYDWLAADAEYAVAFKDAEEESTEALEFEARRRAEYGVQRLVLYQGVPVMVPSDPADPESEKVPLIEHDFSDTLTIFLLKSKRPEKYRENKSIEVETRQVVKHEHHVTVDFDAIEAQLRKVITAGSGNGLARRVPANGS